MYFREDPVKIPKHTGYLSLQFREDPVKIPIHTGYLSLQFREGPVKIPIHTGYLGLQFREDPVKIPIHTGYPSLAVQRKLGIEGQEMREHPLPLVESVVLLTPQTPSQDSQQPLTFTYIL